MLTYTHDPKRQAFYDAIEQARNDGLDFADLATMITAAEHDTQATNGAHSSEPEDVIYEPGELPDGLIDLPSAAEKYGVNRSRLTMWVKRGKVPRLGKLKAAAPGGGYTVTSIEAIEQCLRAPPNKGGRPPKKRVTNS